MRNYRSKISSFISVDSLRPQCIKLQLDNTPSITNNHLHQNACDNRDKKNEKLSYRWPTTRRVNRSVKVNEHGTIPYVKCGFPLVCYSKFVRKSWTNCFQIFNVNNCRDLEFRVRGHIRSFKMVPFDRVNMVSYYSSIVNCPYATCRIQWNATTSGAEFENFPGERHRT